MRNARATQKRNQPVRILIELAPHYPALSFLTTEMGLGQQLAQIPVTGSVLDENGQNPAVFHRQLAADDWPNIMLTSSNGKSLNPINAVAIEKGHCRHVQLAGNFGKLLGERTAAQKAKGARCMQLDVGHVPVNR